jgi:hypothetical protein
MNEHPRVSMMTNHTRHEEEIIFRIGAIAGIVGSLLAMVGNLLHPPHRSETHRAWPGPSPRARDGCSSSS